MRALDPAAARVRHVHPMARDQIEHRVGGASGKIDEAQSALGAEYRFEFVGIVLEPGDDLPAVAAGATPAGLARFEHDCLHAALGKRERGREPGVARSEEHTSELQSP